MPIAGRQMIQLALTGLGEVLALYPAEGSHEPITRIEAALASDKSAEQIRAKCSIPTIALNAKVTAVRAKALSIHFRVRVGREFRPHQSLKSPELGPQRAWLQSGNR